jgi:hypothetical protein
MWNAREIGESSDSAKHIAYCVLWLAALLLVSMVTLEQIEKLLDKKLQGEREHTKATIEAAVQGSEKRIMQAVRDIVKESQEDTIQTLSELIHTGYTHHERRIKRLEEHTHLSPLAE